MYIYALYTVLERFLPSYFPLFSKIIVSLLENGILVYYRKFRK